MKASATVTGVQEILRKLGATETELVEALKAGLYQEGLALDAQSVPQVPVGSPESTGKPGYVGGTLRQSHYVAPPTDGNMEVEVGYGTDYAVYVHEREELRHLVGNAKFLERPFNAIRGGYIDRLARRIADNWRHKVTLGRVPKTAPETPT